MGDCRSPQAMESTETVISAVTKEIDNRTGETDARVLAWQTCGIVLMSNRARKKV